MRLPASMQPWMAWLDQLDPQLAIQLGTLILQIEPLFPAPRAQPITGKEAFDGFNGIINRGHYERLLSSEWMLAEDMPEEFMRRAVENEHMFLAPQLIEPRNDGTCCVIFDTGVHQLGAVRVFHVAMWLVLVRRAAQRGTTLRWAIAQQPAQVYDDCTIDGLKQLLSSRTLAEVDSTMQQQWHSYLAEPQHQASEQWWIGAANDISAIDPDLAPTIAANRISIESCPLGDQTYIQLDAKTLQRKQHLQTPSGKLFSRLLSGKFQILREPVQTAQSDPAQRLVSRHQSLFLSPCGQYVAVLLLNHQAPVWRIPSQGQKRIKQVSRTQRPQEELLACAFSGKLFGGLYPQDASTLGSWQLPYLWMPRDNIVIQHGLPTKMPTVLLRNPDLQRLYLLDHKGQLHWRTASPDGEAKIIAEQVQSLYALSPTQMIYTTVEKGRLVAKSTYIKHRGNFCETLSFKLNVKSDLDKMMLCRNAAWIDQNDAAWARYDQQTTSWWLGAYGNPEEQEIKVAKAARVIALIRDMHGSLGLLVLQPDHCTLALLYNDQPARTLVASPHEIIHAEVSSQHLAWIDSEQMLHFLALKSEQPLPSIDLAS